MTNNCLSVLLKKASLFIFNIFFQFIIKFNILNWMWSVDLLNLKIIFPWSKTNHSIKILRRFHFPWRWKVRDTCWKESNPLCFWPRFVHTRGTATIVSDDRPSPAKDRSYIRSVLRLSSLPPRPGTRVSSLCRRGGRPCRPRPPRVSQGRRIFGCGFFSGKAQRAARVRRASKYRSRAYRKMA